MRRVFLLLFFLSGAISFFTLPQTHAQTPEVKVAFIGDDGISANSTGKVLDLIKNEGAAFVLDQGDLDYTNDPAAWDAFVTAHLGANYPYFVSVGNHDDDNWKGTGGYASFINSRFSRIAKGTGDTCTIQGNNPDNAGVLQHCSYKGIFFVLSGIGNSTSFINIPDADYENHIRTQLASTQAQSSPWKICSWHHNQRQTQVGGKGDSVGWIAYEECRKGGAIIANAHEHSYHRTKTLIDFPNFIVDPACPDGNFLCVAAQKTFAFVSGLGGDSIRVQQRCGPSDTSPDCRIWAKIYTADQQADYGAMFITFNVGGDPTKAKGYFKNIQNQIVDSFDITTGSAPAATVTPGGVTATPPVNQPTSTPGGPTNTPRPPSNCTKANPIQFSCYGDWYLAYNAGGDPTVGDFDGDGRSSLTDFELWRRAFVDANTPTVTPGGATPTVGAPTVTPGTVAPTATPTGGQAATGIWVSQSEIMSRPTSGPAWTALLATANSAGATGGDIANQDSNHDVETLAAALVCARLSDATMCAKARSAVVSAINTEEGGRWLAVGRNLGSYIIAADLLNLYADSNPNSEGSRVHAWLTTFYTRTLQANNDPSIQHGWRQSSWASGSNASAQEGFAYSALAVYLKKQEGLDWSWNGFRRYAGDRTSPNAISSNDLSWQFKPDDIVGIQDAGATKGGCRMDGAIGNDMSRGGSYSCSPGYTSYPWVGLEGAVPAALILDRAGYPAFSIANNAILRTHEYLWDVRQRTGNVDWFDGSRADEVVFLVNKKYGKNFTINGPVGIGRTVGFTDWTHQ